MSKTKIENALEKAKKELVSWFSSTTDEQEKAYATKHAEWVEEKAIKNRFIRNHKGDEVQRKRKFVYWAELGMNVGSELCDSHFCVVVKEFKRTAVVVPISSVKDGDSTWKTEENGFFKIGCIDELPGEKLDSYAVISQIRTVSKKRLSSYQIPQTKKRITMKLNDPQMDIIDQSLKKMLTL